MAHRGPYRWNDEAHTMIVCEKWAEQLGMWVPFAALIKGVDNDTNDQALAEDIWSRIVSGEIIPLPPPAVDPQAQREEMVIGPLQFRRGMRDFPLPRPLPPQFAGAATLRDVYDMVINDSEIPGETKDELEYAIVIERLNPTVSSFLALLGWSETDGDDFFRHCMGK